MNVLYHFRTQGTGAEGVHIAGIARALGRLGHRVYFSSPTGIDPLATAGANPFRQGAGKGGILRRLASAAPGFVFELMELGYNIPAYWKNRRLIAEHGCEMIYERHAYFLASTAWLAAWRKIPLAVEVNELSGDERVRSEPWLGFLARAIDRAVFRRAKAIVVVSPHLKRRICAMGIPAQKILVLPNAVDESLLERKPEAGRIRAQLELVEAIVVGFVGWFVPWHRLDQLIAEFAEAAKAHPRARMLFLGDGPLREALTIQAKELGIGEKVVFAGAVPHEEVPDYLAAMDISVTPHCNAYRSPIKLFEAMAMGCAVLAPGAESIRTVVRDGENGALFDQEQPGDLARQLGGLLSDEGLRRRLGERARADVSAKHTWTRNAAAVLEALAGDGRSG